MGEPYELEPSRHRKLGFSLTLPRLVVTLCQLLSLFGPVCRLPSWRPTSADETASEAEQELVSAAGQVWAVVPGGLQETVGPAVTSLSRRLSCGEALELICPTFWSRQTPAQGRGQCQLPQCAKTTTAVGIRGLPCVQLPPGEPSAGSLSKGHQPMIQEPLWKISRDTAEWRGESGLK